MRIALVYDCLYPRTIGGGERWLRLLAEDLAADHEVTYVTRRLFEPGEDPIPGVECVGVSAGGDLYDAEGRRRPSEAAAFATGVFRHFAARRERYDVVHCLSFPYVPLIALRAALAGARTPRLYCEWLECLSPAWWRAYAGRAGGAAGHAVQRACVRLTPEAFAFSALSERRLREEGLRAPLHRLPGLWTGDTDAPRAEGEREPLVVVAGRHVPDKRVPVAVEAFARARERMPGLRGAFLGDGPEHAAVLERVRSLGLEDAVETPGFVPGERVAELFGRASAALSASVREGYGMAVLEAAGAGAPVVVCRAPDNAAAELVEPGVNGAVAPSPSAEDLARALVEVLAAGESLRVSTAEWFAAEADRRSARASVAAVREVYGRATSR